MIYLGTIVRAGLLMVFLLLAIMLMGCGGVRLNNPATADTSASQLYTDASYSNDTLLHRGAEDGVSGTMLPEGERSVRLNNYNMWHFRPTNGEGRDELLRLVANRDNVVIAEGWKRHNISANTLRALNPQVKVYNYYSLFSKPTFDSDWDNPSDNRYMQFPLSKAEIDANDWWLRDSNQNYAITNSGTWMVDVGKPGFKEAYLEAILQRNAGKGFDGIVFDYLWPYASWIIGHYGLPGLADYTNNEEWFERAWRPFFEYVVKGLQAEGYKVIGNCAGEYGRPETYKNWQRSLLDGTIYEQGAVEYRTNNGDWLPGHRIEERINALANDPLEVWFANNGIRPDTEDFERKIGVSLAMYYIGIPQSQEKRSYGYAHNWRPFWHPLFDFNIGEPLGGHVQEYGKYFWTRNFTHGLVLLNYESSESISYRLDQQYRDVNGNTYSGQVVVPPYTGMILSAIY